METADGGTNMADGGMTLAPTEGGATGENAGTADTTSLEPSDGRNPQEHEDDPEKPSASSGCGPGHSKCTYYDDDTDDKCMAPLTARLVQHIFPDGTAGDLYCDWCWRGLVNIQPKLQCKELGHPMCAHNKPDAALPYEPHHTCIGSPEDDAVERMIGQNKCDTYCVTCWSAMMNHLGIEVTSVAA
eukprot:8615568-Pyramimonas_sp.AAC.1